MAVGFGYIRDDKPTQVDWGQITKDARESIKSIEADKKSRRDKIEQDQRDFTKMFDERPLGGDPIYQRFMGNYSALTSSAHLLLNGGPQYAHLKLHTLEKLISIYRGLISSSPVLAIILSWSIDAQSVRLFCTRSLYSLLSSIRQQ